MTTQTSAHLTYRPDIDGLRAVAVIPVVLFHASPALIPGGFTGVDIFFVISGFLISSIIFGDLERNRFSIVDFYDRRIRRIFPALITVLLATLVVGWMYLLSDEYAQLGKHVAGGTSFISNFLLWGESGYFDRSAETKPLLHLWSLSIEEQFYVFWPLLIAFFWRMKWSFLRITVLIAGLSFVANIYLTYRNPSAAFYFPFSRVWELMLGGLLANIVLHNPEFNRRHTTAKSFLGTALLLAGFVILDSSKRFPGWWALLPTIGAFLLISAGPQGWVNRNVLSSKPLVWIGSISYPLYLWHWPVLVFARQWEDGAAWQVRCAMVVLATLLAWVTFRFIEKPLRHSAPKNLSFKLLSAFLPVGIMGYAVLLMHGMPGLGYRSADKQAFSDHFDNSAPSWKYFTREKTLQTYNDRCNFYNIDQYLKSVATQTPRAEIAAECYERDLRYTDSVLLWGDSHAQHLFWGLKNNLPAHWQLLQVASSGCPAVLGASKSSLDYCKQSNWFAYQTILKAKPDVVIIGQNSGHNIEAMRKLSDALTLIGVKKVVFIGPTPHWRVDLPKVVLRELWQDTPRRTFTRVDRALMRIDENLKAAASSASLLYISVIDNFCNDAGCLIYLGEAKTTGITSFDYGHLTSVASDKFVKDALMKFIVNAP